MTTDLNALGEHSRLTSDQMARWRGLPLCWVDAKATVSAGYREHRRTVLAFLEAGEAEADFDFLTRRQHIDVAAGSMGLFVPGEVHACRWRCSQVRRVMVDIDAAALEALGLHEEFADPESLRPDLAFRDPVVAGLLRGMVQEVGEGSPNGLLFAQASSLALVGRLYERLSVRGPAAAERGRLTAAQMARVDEFVENHLEGEIPLSALAAQVGLSVSHFARLFRNAAGLSPHRYVLRKRVQRTCELLRHTGMPLSSIAAAAGFSTQSHMNAAVKASLGATPGEIRRAAGS